LAQTQIIHGEHLYAELWVSLASLLRSYTAVHGLNGNRQATVELGEQRILARHGEKWLDLERNGAAVIWKREDGSGGMLELTESGRLRGAGTNPAGAAKDEEMDMAAEAWARDLMRELPREQMQ
jgi:hypothetical protein